MALVQMNFESRYLNNNHEISIILPDMPRDKTPAEFYGSGRKYKVLWLLHGTFGDHSDWIRKSNIELYACEKDLIVVMPSGLNANYANWEHFSIGYNMYDYLTEELMPLIYNWFPASDKREDNFIAGLSMGGSGTLVYALNHPEKFAAAAVLVCGFAAGASAGGLARWYMSAAVLLGAASWQWAVQPAVHRAAAALAELACRPLRLVHKMLVRPAQMRLQAAQSRRRACRKAKKSAKIKKSAEKRLQKPSKVLYN